METAASSHLQRVGVRLSRTISHVHRFGSMLEGKGEILNGKSSKVIEMSQGSGKA